MKKNAFFFFAQKEVWKPGSKSALQLFLFKKAQNSFIELREFLMIQTHLGLIGRMSIIYKTSHYNVSHWEYLKVVTKCWVLHLVMQEASRQAMRANAPGVACPLYSSRWPEHPPNAFAVQSIELACRILYTGTCVEFKRYFLARFSIVNPQWLPAIEEN